MQSIEKLDKRLKALREAKATFKRWIESKRYATKVGMANILYDTSINRCIRLKIFASRDLLNKARC